MKNLNTKITAITLVCLLGTVNCFAKENEPQNQPSRLEQLKSNALLTAKAIGIGAAAAAATLLATKLIVKNDNIEMKQDAQYLIGTLSFFLAASDTLTRKEDIKTTTINATVRMPAILISSAVKQRTIQNTLIASLFYKPVIEPSIKSLWDRWSKKPLW